MRKNDHLSREKQIMPEKAPFTCWKRVWYLLRTSWAELVMLNLLTLLCCIPVLTIPAALLAQHRIIICLCGDDGISVTKTFFLEFRNSISVGLVFDVLLLPMVIMLMILSGYSSLLTQGSSGIMLVLLMIFAVTWSWIVYSYAFVMKAAMELRWRDVLINSLLLSILECRKNLQLLLPLFLLATGVFFLPYSCILFLLCLLSLCAVLTSCMVYPALVKHLKSDD